MPYFDFMVVPVQTRKMKEYRALCKKSAALWKKHGAISYFECLADEVKPGKLTSFPQSVKLKKGEAVATSVITFKSKASRNAVWKKVMKDPFFANYDWKKAPFDGKRMFFGGFTKIVGF